MRQDDQQVRTLNCRIGQTRFDDVVESLRRAELDCSAQVVSEERLTDSIDRK